MTFLAPVMGALAATVVVPLVLHLLQRHQGPRMVFPALRYLFRAEREHATRIRLRQILLLALRILAILLIATAATRPFLPFGGRAHVPMAVVVVLDNSMSSGAVSDDRRLLDDLREAALESMAAAGPDDRLWLIRAGQPWEPALTGDPATLSAAIRATEPSSGRAVLSDAVERAAAILESEGGGRAREVQLLSDLQASALEPTGAVGTGRKPALHGAALRILRPAAALPPNRAVGAVEVGGGAPPRDGRRSTVTARIRGYGTTDTVGVRLVLDSTVVAAGRAAPGTTIILPFPPRDTGIVTGYVEINADALTADDRGYFVTEVRRAPAVAVGRSQPFLDEALSVLEDAGRLRSARPATADVLLAPGGDGLASAGPNTALVILPPDSPLERPATNRRLADAGVPWRFGEPVEGEARLAPSGTGLDSALASVRLRQVYPLEPTRGGGDTTLVRLRTGEPWAVAGTTASGRRFVLLASPLTPAGGTLPTSAAMVPLLETIADAWATGAPAQNEFAPGDLVALPAADSIRTPGGGVEPVRPGSVYRLTRAGLYRATRAGRLVEAFAVNPPALGSDLTPATREQISAALAGPDTELVGPDAWGHVIFNRRLGREFSLPFIAAALLLLLVESAVAASGGARGAPASAPVAPPPSGGAPRGAAGEPG